MAVIDDDEVIGLVNKLKVVEHGRKPAIR